MGFTGFGPKEFQAFDIPDFQGRMSAITEYVRPQLSALGDVLLPDLHRLTRWETYAHVAKHARRIVNPPEDTWVAFGPDKRGYKKVCHFKVALSAHCVRFLCEAGPEYRDKARWLRLWRMRAGRIIPALRKIKDLGWFKNEHDEDPAALLSDLPPGQIRALADELTRRKDGQFILGRRIPRGEMVRLSPEVIQRMALKSYEALLPLYLLRPVKIFYGVH